MINLNKKFDIVNIFFKNSSNNKKKFKSVKIDNLFREVSHKSYKNHKNKNRLIVNKLI